ncbi:uncharacterized protein G2W53_019426 [Senna tora]|uniref:Uncharacterized protein n=1 Tax=Senna tora TaxID=362788 RepID=A0A834WMB9_9FABA|nr:uncharacterized protein G2W53_019426 [Senna tora]
MRNFSVSVPRRHGDEKPGWRKRIELEQESEFEFVSR